MCTKNSIRSNVTSPNTLPTPMIIMTTLTFTDNNNIDADVAANNNDVKLKMQSRHIYFTMDRNGLKMEWNELCSDYWFMLCALVSLPISLLITHTLPYIHTYMRASPTILIILLPDFDINSCFYSSISTTACFAYLTLCFHFTFVELYFTHFAVRCLVLYQYQAQKRSK